MTGAGWLVGNDVVDLRESDNASVGDRPRFLERVCDADELARVRAAADPVTALWTLFAAKEAAYKIAVKLRPATILAHRRFHVSPALDAVEHDGLRLALWIDLDAAAGSVHAVASNGARPIAIVLALADELAPGESARRVATRLVAAQLAIAESELAIERPARAGAWDGAGPPVIVKGGAPLGVDVSLSHDGRFVAAAAAIERGASAAASAARPA